MSWRKKNEHAKGGRPQEARRNEDKGGGFNSLLLPKKNSCFNLSFGKMNLNAMVKKEQNLDCYFGIWDPRGLKLGKNVMSVRALFIWLKFYYVFKHRDVNFEWAKD